MTPIKPSQLRVWEEIDQTSASLNCTQGHPENYAWYLLPGVGIWYPHRKPTIDEIYNDMFI